VNLTQYIKLTERKRDPSAPRKTAVFTFGRFSPPTKGHGKLLDKVASEAKSRDADHFIFPSQTVDKPVKKTGKVDPEKSKNPLNWDKKVSFMKKLFPKLNIMKAEKVKSPHQANEHLDEMGYTDIVFVVGSDRVKEFETRWLPYAKDMFETAEIVSAGMRDPDAEGVSGMSATKARLAAKENDIAKFRAATGFGGELSKEMMNAVRKGMGVE